jgi:hypothetical protein
VARWRQLLWFGQHLLLGGCQRTVLSMLGQPFAVLEAIQEAGSISGRGRVEAVAVQFVSLLPGKQRC